MRGASGAPANPRHDETHSGPEQNPEVEGAELASRATVTGEATERREGHGGRRARTAGTEGKPPEERIPDAAAG
jgi:hypothetical protein